MVLFHSAYELIMVGTSKNTMVLPCQNVLGYSVTRFFFCMSLLLEKEEGLM